MKKPARNRWVYVNRGKERRKQSAQQVMGDVINHILSLPEEPIESLVAQIIGMPAVRAMKSEKIYTVGVVIKLVQIVREIAQVGYQPEEIARLVYRDVINPKIIGHKCKVTLSSPYPERSPEGQRTLALEKAQKRWGLIAHVEEDWGTCRVGIKEQGKFKMYGEGATWDEAFQKAIIPRQELE